MIPKAELEDLKRIARQPFADSVQAGCVVNALPRLLAAVDAAEFNARVAALVAEVMAEPSPEEGGCQLPEGHPRRKDCAWCVTRSVRLAVEAEMDAEARR